MIKNKTRQKRIVKDFYQARDYVQFCKKYIYVIIIVFFLAMFISIVFPVPTTLSVQINEMLKKLAESVGGLNIFELILFIFKNNLFVSFIGMYLGIFFGIIPLILAISNGYVIGYVIKLVVLKLGVSDGLFSLWKLFPHGIFEIPAVMISLGIGLKIGKVFLDSLNKEFQSWQMGHSLSLKLGRRTTQGSNLRAIEPSLSNKNSFKELNKNLILAFKVLLFIILPLLLIAAIIEGSLMHLIR